MKRWSVGTIALLMWLCPQIIAQDKTIADEEAYIAGVTGSLEAGNVLRIALEQGSRGDGVHREWMDEMRAVGVKQAAFQFRFSWDGESIIKIFVRKVSYLRQYYHYGKVIRDPQEIEKVIPSGLALTLECEAKKKATIFLNGVLRPGTPAVGTVYANLLDDERLPLLVDLPDIDYLRR
jgi:hypothetical protein